MCGSVAACQVPRLGVFIQSLCPEDTLRVGGGGEGHGEVTSATGAAGPPLLSSFPFLSSSPSSSEQEGQGGVAGGHRTLWCTGLEPSCLSRLESQQCHHSLHPALAVRRSALKALSSSSVKGSGGYLATRTQRRYLKVKRPVRWPLA